jgi:GAF domain-containing protein
VDLIQVIQHSLKSVVHFADLIITRFDLQKGTFRYFLESCDLKNEDIDFNSVVSKEYPIADGLQDVVMNSERGVTFSVKGLPKEGIHIQFLEKKGIRSLAGMRLQHNGEIVGAMLLLSRDEDAFSPGGVRILEVVSNYFATAMLNIIYLDEIRERNNGNEVLLATSEAFSHIRNKEDLLPILKQQLERLSFYSDVAITTVDEDGKRFSSFLINEDCARVGDKDYPAIRNAHNIFPDGVYEIALHAETPVSYDLEALIHHGRAPATVQFLYANGTRAMVGVSLKDKNKPIGVLFLYSDRVISFTPLQLRLVQGIANQLASTVANIMAQEYIQLKEAEKSLLLEFSSKMGYC